MPVRQGAESVILPNGSILMLGGCDGSNVAKSDEWISADKGATWSLVNANALPARWGGAMVMLPDNSIVYMGGYSWPFPNIARNDTWRSIDYGATWVEQNASGGWQWRRYFPAVGMSNGDIVLMGGDASLNPSPVDIMLTDVWKSSDKGLTWTEVNATAWPLRGLEAAVVTRNDTIIMMGGQIHEPNDYYNDVWASRTKDQHGLK